MTISISWCDHHSLIFNDQDFCLQAWIQYPRVSSLEFDILVEVVGLTWKILRWLNTITSIQHPSDYFTTNIEHFYRYETSTYSMKGKFNVFHYFSRKDYHSISFETLPFHFFWIRNFTQFFLITLTNYYGHLWLVSMK